MYMASRWANPKPQWGVVKVDPFGDAGFGFHIPIMVQAGSPELPSEAWRLRLQLSYMVFELDLG